MLSLIFKTGSCTIEQHFDDMTQLTTRRDELKKMYTDGVWEIKKV